MNLVNFGWMLLAARALLLPFDHAGLCLTAAWISRTGLRARGPGLLLWIVAVGALGLYSQPEAACTPLFLGALVGAYNVGGIRPFTLAAALSQVAIVLAPVRSLEAIPFGLAGLCLAEFCAVTVSTLIHTYEELGILETEVLRPRLSFWLRGQES